MTIIHSGPFKEKIYKCSCGKCGTVFEFTLGDIMNTHVYGQDLDYVEVVHCPHCDNYIIFRDYQKERWEQYSMYHGKISEFSAPPLSNIETIDYNESLHKIFTEAQLNNMTPLEWLSFSTKIKTSSDTL